MFITYWFIIFASIFFPVFWLCPIPALRKIWLLIGCMVFHYRFAGPAGVIPIIILGILTYYSALYNKKMQFFTIVLCVLALAFYKYTIFLITQTVGFFNADLGASLVASVKSGILPAVPPLAISFFVFEFVHYLVDVQRGKPPIKSVMDFTLFSIFWPSVVSGPVKRFEQFLPALQDGCRKIDTKNIQLGTMRIISGLIKKLVIADNLTDYINFWQPHFDTMGMEHRWLLVAAISLRILFDFSGYSDIALGFAQLMGIKLPENFNWPYLATNLQDFWQRWHISLSTWIRDYIYIPLGGSKNGNVRKVSNGLIAFAICGLWHGAAWNFIFWGLYHGIGLTMVNVTRPLFAKLPSLTTKYKYINLKNTLVSPLCWLVTITYVSIGWLYFFYPVKEANSMILLLTKLG